MPASVAGQDMDLPEVIGNPHPEPHLAAQHWRAQALESAAMRGFAAGLVTSKETTGWPRQVMPVHPDCVTWYRDYGSGRTEWRVEGREVSLWQEGGELWLAPSPRVTPGSPVGKSVLSYASQKVKLGLEASKFGFDYFAAGGLPVSHLKVDDEGVTPAQAAELKQRVMQATRNREPLVSGAELTLAVIDVKAEESQFLETISANVAQVCMFFGIPPESIGGTAGDSLTYQTLEGRNLQLLTNTVGAWMQWLEWVMSSLLPGRLRVDLDPESMLRTSVSMQYDNAQKGVGRGNTPGFLTANEARALLGYEPHAGGDDIYVPVNYGPAGIIEEVLVGTDG
jgi:HK97 family phage portal protein